MPEAHLLRQPDSGSNRVCGANTLANANINPAFRAVGIPNAVRHTAE